MPATSRFAAPGRLILAFALALLVALTGASAARAAGTIELVKNQVGAPDNGSGQGTVDFTFRTANFGSGAEQTGFVRAEEDGAKSWSVPANDATQTVYQLEEHTPPVGWALTGIACTNPGGGTDADTTIVGTFANIKVSDGQTVTCTFTNAPPQCNPAAGPFAPLPFSKFQGIDGDQCDQNGLTGSLNQWFDWQKITRDGGFKAPNGDGSTSIDADAVPMGVFKGGSKEEEPSGWVLQSGSPNGKTNILAQWGFPETTTTDPLKDHLFLYLAFARQQESGSTNFAFELNQNAPTETFLVPTTGNEPKQPAIKRRDGDVLIAYNWNGNAPAEISLCEWTGDDPAQPWLKGTWSGPLAVNNDPCPIISDNVGATTAQGRSNDWTVSNYLPGVSSILPPGHTMPATTFGEASVDLTEALELGAPGGDPCASFGAFWMRSRTSPSITATPMDLIPPQAVHVANCGTVKIKKVTSPNPDPTTTSFDFTGSGFTSAADGQQGTSPASFSLANGQTEEIIKVEPNDQVGDPAYSITEQAETGWNLTGLSCVEDKTANSTTSTVTGVVGLKVEPGETIECTYTNSVKPASLTVVKDAAPNHAQDFGFAQSGLTGQSATFDLDDDADNTLSNTKTYANRTDFGKKLITETPAVSGWTLSNIACTGTAAVRYGQLSNGSFVEGANGPQFGAGDTTAEVDLQADKTATCTFTNSAAPASLSVIKDASPNHEQDFGFTQSGLTGETGTFDLDDDADGTLQATKTYGNRSDFGTKLVTEAPVSGWTLSNIACTGTAAVRYGQLSNGAFVGGPGGDAFALGDTTVEVDLQPGKTASCTFLNVAAPASLSIVKNASPDHPQDFAFDQTGLTGEAPTFDLDDDANNTLSNTKAYGNRTDFGKKVISEDGVANWTITDIACTGTAAVRYGQLDQNGAFTLGAGTAAYESGDTAVEVDLQPGKTASCTFTNTADAASLAIVKDAVPDHAQDFGFAQDGLAAENATFDLDDDANNTLSNTKTYGNRNDFGTKVVREVGVANWSLSGIACTGTATVRIGKADANGQNFTLDNGTGAFQQGDNAVEVDLQPGKTASCTFTNTADAASLAIVKDAVPDHAQDFGFAQTGVTGQNATFDLDDDANNTLSNTKTYGNRTDFGTKVVREVGVADWSLSGIACTGTATVRIGKADANGQNFTLDNGTGAFQQGDNAVEVDLQPGKTASCTFTNTAAPASVTIVKNAVPEHEENFGFDQIGFAGENASFALDDDADNALSDTKSYAGRTDFGTKLVTEGVSGNWSLTNIVCTGTATVRIGKYDGNASAFTLDNKTAGFEAGDTTVEIDLQPGKSASCTFTNTADPASLTVVKDAAPNHAQDFGFSQTGLANETATFDLDDDGDNALSNTKSYSGRTDFGAKRVTETPTSGWTLSDIVCTGNAPVTIGRIDQNGVYVLGGGTGFDAGDTTVEVNLQPGLTASCTFTNTAVPSTLTIVKDASPDHGQDFGFDQSGLTNEAAAFDLDDDADNTLSNTKSYGNRTDFGKKLISEDATANWTLSGIACTGTAAVRYGQLSGGAFVEGANGAQFGQGDTTVEVDLQPGKSASCTFTNTATPAIAVVVKDADPNHSQNFAFAQDGFANEDATFSLDDDADNALSNTKTYDNRTDFGTKLVTETPSADWSLTNIACTGTATVRIGKLDPNGAFTLDGKTGGFEAGDTTVEIDVQPGKSATCTFTNTAAPGSVTIVKDAAPDHAQDFGFTQDGLVNESATFDLDDDADNTLSNTKTYGSRTDFGKKVISEDGGVANWSLTDITCTGTAAVRIGTLDNAGDFTLDNKTDGYQAGDTAVEIDVQPGKSASCTFTNTARPGSVTIVKDAAPDHGQDFAFAQDGLANESATFDLDDDADNTLSSTKSFGARTDFGTKVVREAGGVAHWTLTGIACTGDAAVRIGKADANGQSFTLDGKTGAFEPGDNAVEIDVQPGKSASCTFTNTADEASLTVAKDADPNHAQDFGFAQDGLVNETGTFDLDDDGDNTLLNTKAYADRTDFGKKLVTETPSANWSLSAIACTGTANVRIGKLDQNGAFTLDGDTGGFEAGDTTVEVDLQPGLVASCTFTNTAAPASLEVVKDAAPDHGQDFGFAQDGLAAESATFDLDDDANGTLSNTKAYGNRTDFGTKVVRELGVSNWSLTAIACTGTATVRIGKADANGQSFTVDGKTGGFEAGDNAVEIDLQPGKAASCTFTNTAAPALAVVVKDADPDHGQNFVFEQDGLTNESGTFDLDDDADNTLSNTKTYDNRTDFGTKLITETPSANWTLSNIACTGDATVRIGKLDNAGDFTLDGKTGAFEAGDTTIEVDLQPGKTASCTFTNTAAPGSITVIKDAAPDHAQDFGFAQSGLTGEAATFDLDDDANGTLSDTKTYADRKDFGTKVISETGGVASWTLTGIACTGDATVRIGKLDNGGGFTLDAKTAAFEAGDDAVEIDLQPGKSASCTFVNTADPASLEIVKDADPNHAQDFAFDQTGLTGENATFDLDDDANNTLSDTKTYANRTDFGTKVISEDAGPNGWTLTNIACAGSADVRIGKLDGNGAFTLDGKTAGFEAGDTAVEADLQPGKAASCTFTNTGRGTLVVEKQTAPDETNGATFGFTTAAPGGASSFSLADDATDSRTLPPGSYTVTEGTKIGYRLTDVDCDDGDSTQTGDTQAVQDRRAAYAIEVGETVKCTFTNLKINASTVVVKSGNEFAYHGDDVTFSFEVTNPGNSPLHDVVVTDDRCTNVTGPVKQVNTGDPNELDPGDKWIYSCTMPVPAHTGGEQNPFRNVVTVTAKDEQDQPVSGTDDHLTRILHPAIAVDKTGPAEGTAGLPVTYEIAVSNPGDIGFASDRVTVQDQLCEAPPIPVTDGKRRGDGADPTPATLDPGDTWLYRCTVQTAIGQERVDNVVNVGGTDPNGRTVQASDTAGTLLRQPVQQVEPQRAQPGSARLQGPASCVTKPFKVVIRGREIDAVTLFVRGKAVRTLRARQAVVLSATSKRVLVDGKVQTVRSAQSQQVFTFRIDPRKLRAGAVHRVSARVAFTTASGTKTRNLKFAFQRCQAARAPRFTG